MIRSSLPHTVSLLLVGVALVASELLTNTGWTAVAVLANRTRTRIAITLQSSGQPAQRATIEVGESQPAFFDQSLRVRFQDGLIQREFELSAANAYFFTYGLGEGSLHLEKIGLGEEGPSPGLPVAVGLNPSLAKATIPVKLLVDDDEPTHRRLWEARLRKRIAAASKILEGHSGISLQVEAVATWDSDDQQHDFNSSLREFEREVSPQPARLAIGFSSQYKIAHGRVHMGGTRGALYPYILLKERSPNVRETERLEMLVHELGHYLGASHSPEPYSVMRPVISGGQQRALGSRIQFDPVNTLLVAMMGEEIRQRKVRNLTQVSTHTKKRMAQIYGVLNESLPDDPAASRYLQLIQRAAIPPIVENTRAVLDRLTKEARLRNNEPGAGIENIGEQASVLGKDSLTEAYVQVAASEGQRLRSENPRQAVLLALGIFFDDTTTLRNFPATRAFVSRVESNQQRQDRLQVLAAPTMRGRTDLAKHFFVSAHLTAAIGSQAARSAGLAKELLDAQGATGFSFADMAANQAGIVFAESVIEGNIPLADLAGTFKPEAYLPEIEGLEEGLSTLQLKERFDGPPKEGLEAELNEIQQSILELPIYASAAPGQPPEGRSR